MNCKDEILFGTGYEGKECRKCPKYNECVRAYAKVLIEQREAKWRKKQQS